MRLEEMSHNFTVALKAEESDEEEDRNTEQIIIETVNEFRFRVDKSRSRVEETETSGAGLGLSIARWITEIHHGKIKLVSSDAGGSVFAVKFPRQNYTDEQK